MKIEEASQTANEILSEVKRHIIGKAEVLNQVLTILLSDGHLLFEDYPGLAKTMICRSFAQTIGGKFSRIQFTPDLLPQDLTGSDIYNQKTNEFEFKEGPLFSHVVLADEINRATPKTQSALLEAMAEYQVSISGRTYDLTEDGTKPFLVIATQNPLEIEGTFPLPEAQLDRFAAKINVGYPSREAEKTILLDRIKRGKKSFDVAAITNPTTFREMQKTVEKVSTSDEIIDYILDIVRTTRETNQVKVGSSPRGSLDLMAASKAYALLEGRDYVIPNDVKKLAPIVLGHRLVLEIGSWLSGTSPRLIIEKIIDQIKTPRKD